MDGRAPATKRPLPVNQKEKYKSCACAEENREELVNIGQFLSTSIRESFARINERLDTLERRVVTLERRTLPKFDLLIKE